MNTLTTEQEDEILFGGMDDDLHQPNPSKLSIDQASHVNPDEFARDRQLAKDVGLSTDIVKDNRQEIERRSKVKKIEDDILFEGLPTLNKFLENPDNAKLSFDDVNQLGEIERSNNARPWQNGVDVFDVALTLPAGLLEGTGAGIKGVGEIYDSYSRIVNRGVKAILPESVENYLYDRTDENATLNKAVNTLFNYSRSFKGLGQKTKDVGVELDLDQQQRESLTYAESVGIDIIKGTGQVAGQIVTALVNPALGMSQLLGQGADQAAERQIQSGAYGTDLAADLGVLSGAAITAGTEKVGIDLLLERIPPNIKNKIVRNLTDVVLAGGGEAIQEITENILQGVNEIITSNPDADILEGLDREALAAGGTGMVVRSLINMITPSKNVTNAMDNNIEKQVRSEAAEAWLDQQIFLAQGSKTNERDAEIFAEYIQSLDPDSYVYLNAEIAGQIQDAPQYITDQLDGTGASVSISLSKFLTEFANDESRLNLVKPHIKVLPELLSREEMDQGVDNLQIKKLMESAEKNKEAKTEADLIFEQIQGQIKTTGRQGENTSRLSAQLIPAYIVTKQSELASRGIDVSVKDLYSDMGLNVIGPKDKPSTEVKSVLDQEQDLGNLTPAAKEEYDYILDGLSEEDVQYAFEDLIDVIDEGRHELSRKDVNSIRQVAIDRGMYREITDTELKNVQVSGRDGKKYDFSLNKKKYVYVNQSDDVDISDISLSQNFDDMELTDTGQDESGNTLVVKEKAQSQWNHHQKRLKMLQKLKDCLNG